MFGLRQDCASALQPNSRMLARHEHSMFGELHALRRDFHVKAPLDTLVKKVACLNAQPVVLCVAMDALLSGLFAMARQLLLPDLYKCGSVPGISATVPRLSAWPLATAVQQLTACLLSLRILQQLSITS